VQIGPEMRRGISDLNGEGEVAGGVIIMRSGKNALESINAAKAKLAQLKASLPPGIEIVPTYDRYCRFWIGCAAEFRLISSSNSPESLARFGRPAASWVDLALAVASSVSGRVPVQS
jgi:AcrB/AcrD/AcrF family